MLININLFTDYLKCGKYEAVKHRTCWLKPVIQGRLRCGPKLSPEQAGEPQTNAARGCGHRESLSLGEELQVLGQWRAERAPPHAYFSAHTKNALKWKKTSTWKNASWVIFMLPLFMIPPEIFNCTVYFKAVQEILARWLYRYSLIQAT